MTRAGSNSRARRAFVAAAVALALAAPGAGAGAAQAAEGADAMSAAEAASELRYVPLPDGEAGYVGALPEIYVEGPIGETTVAQLRRIVDAHGLTAARVRFDSRGGDLLAALELGHFLRDRGFVTEVAAFDGGWGRFRPGQCLSACAVAYLGGRYRYLDPGSRMAVHRFSTPRAGTVAPPDEIEQEVQALVGALVAYLARMGVDSEFFLRMSQRPHADLEYLGRDELARMGVVNDGRMPPSWGLEIRDGEVVLAGRQERIANSAEITLHCNAPLEVRLQTPHFDPGWGAALAPSGLHWAFGDERVPVDPRQFADAVSLREGEFRAAVGLDAARAARLAAARAVGLSVAAGGRRFDYEVAVEREADRDAIRRFVEFCVASGGAGARPAGPG